MIHDTQWLIRPYLLVFITNSSYRAVKKATYLTANQQNKVNFSFKIIFYSYIINI
ncbi:hypothetical protein SAMN05421639_10318 [Chryseobacterium shigense]|uniref:Uncharacterized protein n=1 Tax=Chryseobacterium shigense TaxID=297244 RepID=A0A1N7IC66_9FLAO|nr:hypothetical protein SAMN05421639_10318 [Chryseobacterium shigense]